MIETTIKQSESLVSIKIKSGSQLSEAWKKSFECESLGVMNNAILNRKLWISEFVF